MRYARAANLLICMGLQATITLLLTSHPARCQTSPSLPLTKQGFVFTVTQQTLSQVIAHLSKQIGRSIIVDDEPSDRKVDIKTMGTVGEALDAVTATFDYTWSVNKRGIIMMRKAFRNPETLPQMNLPEMRQMAQDALDTLSPFPINPSGRVWPAQCGALARSFTPAQAEPLRAGKTLFLKDLSLEQGSLLQQIILNHAFTSLLEGWTTLRHDLDQLPLCSLEARSIVEKHFGVEEKGIALDQILLSPDGKDLRSRLTFVPEEKKQEKKQ